MSLGISEKKTRLETRKETTFQFYSWLSFLIKFEDNGEDDFCLFVFPETVLVLFLMLLPDLLRKWLGIRIQRLILKETQGMMKKTRRRKEDYSHILFADGTKGQLQVIRSKHLFLQITKHLPLDHHRKKDDQERERERERRADDDERPKVTKDREVYKRRNTWKFEIYQSNSNGKSQ